MRGIAYKKGKNNYNDHISLFQLIYSNGISGKIMKAMDETDDKIMTVMLKNDQTLTKVTG